MSEFKITERGWYKTRDGSKVEVVHVGESCASVAQQSGSVYLVNHRGVAAVGTDSDIISRWIEPAVGTREWAMSLPWDTKVWNKAWRAVDNLRASELTTNCYPDGWFIVGSAEWANALPEGTCVTKSVFSKGTHFKKAIGLWRRSDCSHRTTALTTDGWLLYTEPTVGSREWAMALPPETKVWNRNMRPGAAITPNDLGRTSFRDGWFIVGSSEWANALPVGTRVRLDNWPKHRWISKDAYDHWYNENGSVTCQPVVQSGWLLYIPPTSQPWSRPEDVPVEAIVRSKRTHTNGWGRILFVSRAGIGYTVNDNDMHWTHLCPWDKLDGVEHSTDGGKTWKPCVKEEQ